MWNWPIFPLLSIPRSSWRPLFQGKPPIILLFTNSYYCLLLFYNLFTKKYNLQNKTLTYCFVRFPGVPGSPRVSSQKVQRVREGWRRLEKVGECQRRLEKVREDQRRSEKVRERQRKLEKVRESPPPGARGTRGTNFLILVSTLYWFLLPVTTFYYFSHVFIVFSYCLYVFARFFMFGDG